jgi:hypothetical protein
MGEPRSRPPDSDARSAITCSAWKVWCVYSALIPSSLHMIHLAVDFPHVTQQRPPSHAGICKAAAWLGSSFAPVLLGHLVKQFDRIDLPALLAGAALRIFQWMRSPAPFVACWPCPSRPGGAYAPLALPRINRFCMAIFDGCAAS